MERGEGAGWIDLDAYGAAAGAKKAAYTHLRRHIVIPNPKDGSGDVRLKRNQGCRDRSGVRYSNPEYSVDTCCTDVSESLVNNITQNVCVRQT